MQRQLQALLRIPRGPPMSPVMRRFRVGSDFASKLFAQVEKTLLKVVLLSALYAFQIRQKSCQDSWRRGHHTIHRNWHSIICHSTSELRHHPGEMPLFRVTINIAQCTGAGKRASVFTGQQREIRRFWIEPCRGRTVATARHSMAGNTVLRKKPRAIRCFGHRRYCAGG